MKFEKNMYVRTDDGYINKIKKVNQYNVLVDARDLFGEELNIPNNEIVKASHNIIDLIEVGDYVNGGQVREKTNDYIRISGGEFMWQYLKREEDIKSIVTKEQFEAIKYEIK